MRIEQLRVRNYRVLRDVTFDKLTPLTVLCGANGSGKSTVFDVFAFLHQAFTQNLRAAWDDRNRIDAIRSRGATGPVVFELKYFAPNDQGEERLVTYQLSVSQKGTSPIVESEKLTWSTAPGSGRPRDILSFQKGRGKVFDEASERTEREELSSSDLLAVSALGQFRTHPRIKALRDFVQGWYLSYVSADSSRTTPRSGPEPRLSQSGDNLANVIQFLSETHPDRLETIFHVLARRVPQLERVLPQVLDDGRLLLLLKDRPFERPVLANFASDGTLKLLAYLTVLYDPNPFAVIGIEEPENQLHPKLLPVLAEEIREVSARSQVLVTTHSPEFVNSVRPRELWALDRGEDGFTRVHRADQIPGVVPMIEAGAALGSLWSEGYLTAADPAGLS